MKAVKVETDGSIKLPKEMLRLFPTASELAVWTERDMIVLKRLQPLKPSRIAERVLENGPPLAARGRSPIFTKRTGSARSDDLGSQIVLDRIFGGDERSFGRAVVPTE